MEFRIKKTACCVVWCFASGTGFSLWGSTVQPLPAQPEARATRYEARHDHWRKWGAGVLTLDERGVAFEESGKKKDHRWRWDYPDIQRLELAPDRLRVLTYKDNRWKLGADRAYEFRLTGGQNFAPAYELLKDRLDQRFVAELADTAVKPLWQIPVKRLGVITGTEGVLAVGEDRIVYRSSSKAGSHTWRIRDLENVSTSGPFQLTLTTLEKQFNFQLKQALDEDRYDDLWRRIHRSKGLKLP